MSKENLWLILPENTLQDENKIDLDQKKKDGIIETHFCSKDEVEYAILHMKNSSEGKDEVPTKVFKKAWQLIETYYSFFEMCLINRHHLKCFQTAISYTLSKSKENIPLLPIPALRLLEQPRLVIIWS